MGKLLAGALVRAGGGFASLVGGALGLTSTGARDVLRGSAGRRARAGPFGPDDTKLSALGDEASGATSALLIGSPGDTCGSPGRLAPWVDSGAATTGEVLE